MHNLKTIVLVAAILIALPAQAKDSPELTKIGEIIENAKTSVDGLQMYSTELDTLADDSKKELKDIIPTDKKKAKKLVTSQFASNNDTPLKRAVRSHVQLGFEGMQTRPRNKPFWKDPSEETRKNNRKKHLRVVQGIMEVLVDNGANLEELVHILIVQKIHTTST